jgi:DNA-binding response OmpR family regulator
VPHRILVVDDEPPLADTLVKILRYAGHESTAAYDGHQALEFAANHGPALVICDVVMPTLNGVEFAIKLKSINPDCRILLLSGHAATHDLLATARDRGYSFEILAKPVPPRELLAKVTAMLNARSGSTTQT